MTPKILSTHPLHPEAEALIGGRAELVVASALDAGTLDRESRGCDVVIVRAPLPEAMFEGPTRLRAAIRHGAGLDMIPVEASTRAGVLVANVPGVNAPTVAEHVVMTSLMLLRRNRVIDRDLHVKGWNAAREHAPMGRDLAGQTVGFVGMGAIGRAASTVMRALGAHCVGYSPSGRGFPEGVASMSLDGVASAGGIVVLCCPLTPETRGLFDARRLGLMRPGAFLINVARGPVADERALVEALGTGKLGGAALDVFKTQPLPDDHPFLAMPNVVLTPHMAGITDESMARMGKGAMAEALRVLGGELPVHLVNPEAVARYRERFA